MTEGHHLIIITGANRGFGASIAHTYLESSQASTLSYVLVGRNQAGLQNVLDALKQTGASSNITVKGLVVANVDLADTDTLDANLTRIQEAAKHLRDESLQSTVLINNVSRFAACD
jgi:sepiapterin reductase